MDVTLLVSAMLVGALGGTHCVAMCGGLVGAIAARDAAHRRGGLAAHAATQAFYHAGRVFTYALLGAAFGVAGTAARLAADLALVQRTIYVAADVFLLMLAASFVVRVAPVLALQRAGSAAVAPLLRRAQPWLRVPGTPGRLAMGLVWGLMPCALVYSVLPLALLGGGAWQGALVMIAFGLGTLPNLLAGGVLLARARSAVSAVALRYVAAGIIASFGLLGLWRALAGHGALPALPFCLVP